MDDELKRMVIGTFPIQGAWQIIGGIFLCIAGLAAGLLPIVLGIALIKINRKYND